MPSHLIAGRDARGTPLRPLFYHLDSQTQKKKNTEFNSHERKTRDRAEWTIVSRKFSFIDANVYVLGKIWGEREREMLK